MKAILAIIISAIFLFGCAGSLTLPEGRVPSKDKLWGTPRGHCDNWAFAFGSGGEPELLWRTKIGSPIICSPVAGDGAIFVGTPNKRIHALDANTGERIGKLWVDVPIEDGLSYSEGIIAFTGRTIYNRLKLYSLSSKAFVWDKSADFAMATPIFCEDAIFFPTAKGVVFRIDKDSGEKVWRTELPQAVVEYEPAFRDSLLFISDSNGRLFALSADSGAIRWKVELPAHPVGPPVVIPDHVIVPTSSGKIPVITLDGSTRTTVESPGELLSPIACSGPTIYGITRSGIAFAGDLGYGGILWQTSLRTPVISAPVVWGPELAVISAEGKLILLDIVGGVIRYELDLKTPITVAPIVYENRLYIGTEKGEIIAVGRGQK